MNHAHFFLKLVYKQDCKGILCTLSSKRMHNMVTFMLINNAWLKISYPEKCVGKGHPMTCLCRHRGEVEIQLQPIHNPALGGGWSAPHSSLLPVKTQHPLYRTLTHFQGQSGWAQKILPPPGFDPQPIQPVASCYTNYTMYTHLEEIYGHKSVFDSPLLFFRVLFYTMNTKWVTLVVHTEMLHIKWMLFWSCQI